MKRFFFGNMPYNCVEKEVRFDTGNGLYLTIEAGPEGWTIIYADGGTEYKDIVDTTENNFNEAYECAKRYFPKMRKEKCNGNTFCGIEPIEEIVIGIDLANGEDMTGGI